MPKGEIIKQLEDGLVLRRSCGSDRETLAHFNAAMHVDEDAANKTNLASMTRDLFESHHPTFSQDDFTIVEDPTSRKIVSACCLISQQWSYEGVPIKVGRPELVATLPEYRRRGLIREQFALLHEWSEERGELLQSITGIPWYYRQFDYEMSLELGGGRVSYRVHLPDPAPGKKQDYQIRPASIEDAAFLAELSEIGAKRYLVSCIRDEKMWAYEISGRRRTSEARVDIWVIESRKSEPVGYLLLAPRLWGPTVVVIGYEIEVSEAWHAVTPSVLHFLRKRGEELARRQKKTLGAFAFWMGTQHPVYEAIANKLPRKRDPYTWYLRVPNKKLFLKRIAPVLEKRLAQTNLVSNDCQLRLNFYRTGLKLEFKDGKLARIEDDEPEPYNSNSVSFPNRTFLQVLFGYRTLEELEFAFPDCFDSSDEARALVKVLFPKRPSHVWGLG